MNLRTLAGALNRAAELLRVSGAKSQSATIAAVADTVAACNHPSVDAFVNETKAKINAPKPHEWSAQEFVDRLNSLRGDRTKTLEMIGSLKSSAFDKAKVIEIAKLLLSGRHKLEFKTKPQAVKAIEERVRERLYLDSKDAMNAKVAPW